MDGSPLDAWETASELQSLFPYNLTHILFCVLARLNKALSEYELAEKQFNADVSRINVQYMNDKRKAHNTFWQHMDAKYKF